MASAVPVAPTPLPSTAIRTPSPTPIALPTNAFVAAAGGGVVWVLVASSRLFRSLDRGDTWEERTAPAVINGNVAFVDAREGWALSAGSPATGCMGQLFEVFHTTDGAATWSRLYRSPEGDPGCKSDLAFVDATRGYITVSTRDSGSVILRSMDGGGSWSGSLKLPNPPDASPDPGASYANRPGPVADFGSVLLASVGTQTSSGATSSVYRSTDHGETWGSAATAPIGGTPVVFVTPTRWIQLLLHDTSVETTDAGRTWHPLATDYRQAAPVAPQVIFGEPNVGYATVRGSIQRTTDGGVHWSFIKTPGTLSP